MKKSATFIAIFITVVSAFSLDALEIVNSKKFNTLGVGACTSATCTNSSQCTFGYCDTTSNTCKQPQYLAVSSACYLGEDHCIGGSCISVSSQSPIGMCVTYQLFNCSCNYNTSNQAPIQSDATCSTAYCSQAGVCDNPNRIAGSFCSQGYECASNSCVAGYCASTISYGQSCANNNGGCPGDAYCGTTLVCLKYATLNQNCNATIKCGLYLYCDVVSQTCLIKGSAPLGQNCTTDDACADYAFCNTTYLNPVGTCVSAATLANQNCSNSVICRGSAYQCNCIGNSSTCNIQSIGNNCDSQRLSFYSCANSNCPYLSDVTTKNSCLIQNCSSAVIHYYCCAYYNLPGSIGQYYNAIIENIFDCTSFTFIPSPCSFSPSEAGSLNLNLFMLIFVVLTVILLQLKY